MRLKLDENLPEDARASALALGHDVDTVLDEALGGATDPDVLAAAVTTFLANETLGDLTGCIVVVRGRLVRIRRPD